MSKGKKKRTALGNRLRTLRRYNGMTQRELHTLSEIAGLFQVSTDYLLGRGEYTIPIGSIRWVPVPAFPAAGAPNKKAPPDP